MPTQQEKFAFSERLKFALKRSTGKDIGATRLAVQFNLRFNGDKPISPQTAFKWLTGRAIPTQEKLNVLAEWLKVDVHWLHYGESPKQKFHLNQNYPVSPEVIELANKIGNLSSRHRYLVEELVEQLYDSEKMKEK